MLRVRPVVRIRPPAAERQYLTRCNVQVKRAAPFEMKIRYAFYSWFVVLFCSPLAAAQPDDRSRAGFAEGVVESSDGVQIAYESGGDADSALVFVHCWTCNRTFWREQLSVFAEAGYRVVAVDLGGHGTSGTNRDDWTMDAFGEDVTAVVNALELQDVILVGHSMGGSVALEAAEKLSGRVKGIVLVDSFRDPEDRMTEEEIDEFLGPLKSDFRGTTAWMVRQYMFAPGTDSVFVERISEHMASFDPAIGIGSIEQLFRADYRDAFRSLQVPVKAINAGYVRTDVQSMRHFGIDVVILPDVGHFLMLERPELFNGLLMEALSTM